MIRYPRLTHSACTFRTEAILYNPYFDRRRKSVAKRRARDTWSW